MINVLTILSSSYGSKFCLFWLHHSSDKPFIALPVSTKAVTEISLPIKFNYNLNTFRYALFKFCFVFIN